MEQDSLKTWIPRRAPGGEKKRPSPTLLMVLAFLFVIVPFLTWYLTWFGRPLTDAQIEAYLTDEEKPRHAQHALSRLADRMMHGDRAVTRWYPKILELADHPLPEIRQTVAWVMGQDNASVEFHQALRRLLDDPVPIVRWNAALALVRFGDASGRRIIRQMLRPYVVSAPREGIVTSSIEAGTPVHPGTGLVVMTGDNGQQVKVRSPVTGRVEVLLVPIGSRVAEGHELIRVTPASETVYEALRALYLIGDAEDLPEVNRYASGVDGMSEAVRQQAILTAQAIRQRQSK